MSIYRLVVDQDRCIACHACEASCKAAHDAHRAFPSERCLSMAPL
ncbi:MAG: 4Fe-4S binding protein [Bilophila wadsworthia]